MRFVHIIARSQTTLPDHPAQSNMSVELGEDYYEVLGIEPAATTEVVRNAYKEKAMKHHPDRGGDRDQWTLIQKAFDTLTDLQKRQVYDRTKADAEGGAERQFQQKFGEGAFDLSPQGDVARVRKGGMSIMKQVQAYREGGFVVIRGWRAYVRPGAGGQHF